MTDQIDIIGYLWMAWAAFQALLLILVALLMLGVSLFLFTIDEEGMVIGAMYGIGTLVVSGISFIFIAVQAWIGKAILNRQPIGRLGGFVLAALNLTAFPGILLSIYTIIVLLDKDVTAEFKAG